MEERISRAMVELSQALAQTEDAREIHDFLLSILTPSEVVEVGSRWALVRLIDEGKSQRNISKDLGLSLCKITRGSKELKKPHSSFKTMIKRYLSAGAPEPTEPS